MSKKLLLVAASLFSLFTFSEDARAQTELNLFQLPDTVCAGHKVVPSQVVDGAQNYNWTFCPPDLFTAPSGINAGVMSSLDSTRGMIIARDEGVSFSYHLNGNGNLVRMRFLDGFSGSPSLITTVGNIPMPGGLYAVSDGIWHIFVVADTGSHSRVVRFDFDNGLKAMPTDTVDLGNLGGGLNTPKHIFIAQDTGKWYGFTFTKDDELVRLDFGNNLLSVPTLTNLGNIDGHFAGVSGMTGLRELGNWHLLITNKDSNNVNRIAFGNSLGNVPFVVNLGDMNSRIKKPVGIALTKGCDAYYAYVLNYGTASLVTLKWDDQSIANQPVAVNHGNVAGFNTPKSLSGIAEENGALYMFAPNSDNSLSKIFFNPCTNSSIPSSEEQYPPAFSYDEPGIYSVFLTINQGLPDVQTDCFQITISDRPAITVSNDTMICEGDTINLSILSLGPDSFRWSPDFRINTTEGQFVRVWPDYTTQYIATAYFAPNCIVPTPVRVTVSKITADAGPDRIISDGSVTVLGGGETTIGTQYSYLWTPDIGVVGSTATPVTEARPPYDLTYYLHVSNTDGCKAIDSVLVTVPCDDIHLPNAFMPESKTAQVSKFGLKNQELVKINYFKIFDRWGKEVFSTTNVNGEWDGKVDGNPAPMGVYIWEVDANCANTLERFRRSGTVTLIR